MKEHRLANYKSETKIGLLKIPMLLILLNSFSITNAQENESPFLPAEEILRFRCEISPGSVNFYFSYIPPALKHRHLLIINTSKHSSAGFEINTIIYEHRQWSVEFISDWQTSDTFLISLNEDYAGINYIPQRIVPGVTNSEIKMGENCYKLLCEPENDPWMPNANKPFLFSQYDYYINPKNGKLLQGERIINSLRYSACELESWELIYADEIDSYRANLKAKKKQARQNRKNKT